MSILHYFPLTAREIWLGAWGIGLAKIPYRVRSGDEWPPEPPFALGTQDDPYPPLLAASSHVSADPTSPSALHLWNIDDATAVYPLVSDTSSLYLAFDLDIRRFRQLEQLLGASIKPPRRYGLIGLPDGEAGRIACSLWEQGWPDIALIANPSPTFIEHLGSKNGLLHTGILLRRSDLDFTDFFRLVEQCDWLLSRSVNGISHMLCTHDLSDKFDSDSTERVQWPLQPIGVAPPSQAWLDAITADTDEIDVSDIDACDLRPLIDYPNIQRLKVCRRWWLDTYTISQLSQLTSLDMRICWVEDLDFLQHLRRLRQLHLNVEPLRGWQTLSKLPNSLHSLDLEYATIEDLTPLSRLSSLQTLNIASTAVRDLTPLCELQALAHLDVIGCAIEDWSAVNRMNGLQTLTATEVHIPEAVRERLKPNITLQVE